LGAVLWRDKKKKENGSTVSFQCLSIITLTYREHWRHRLHHLQWRVRWRKWSIKSSFHCRFPSLHSHYRWREGR
jgi:hypothetical protein